MFKVDSKGLVQVDDKVLMIPEFKVLYERDKSLGKLTCMEEFKYIYFLVDYNSPYRGLREDERLQEVEKDYKVLVDESLTRAIKKYDRLQENSNVRFFNSLEKLKDKMSSYFDSIDSIDAENIDSILKVLEKSSLVLVNSNKSKEVVEKDKAKGVKIEGGGDVGLYEDGF